MAQPTNRTEFIEYCLRKLGAPVINIDVAQEQIEDRVDDALKFYQDYHYDGNFRTFLKHQLTQEDVDRKYIEIPENIVGVTGIFNMGTSISASSGMFSIQYQIALNDLYAFSGVDLVPYWVTMENLQFIEEVLVGRPQIRYNRHMNNLHIDINKEKLAVGSFIIADCYQVLDPEEYTDVWKDRWLTKYATALIKEQWGNNITKFSGVQMPGGVTFNGDQILQSAKEEIRELEQSLMDNAPLTAFEIG